MTIRISTSTRYLLVACIGALVTTAGGCGGGDATPGGSAGKRPAPTTTTRPADPTARSGVADAILRRASSGAQIDDSGFDEAIAECVADSVTESVGEIRANAMADAEVSAYSEEEVKALAGAFDKCVPGRIISESITRSFYTGAGAATEPSIETVACVSQALEGRTGRIVAEGARVGSGAVPEVTLEVMDRCIPASDVTVLLEKSFLDAGLTQDQATCTSKALEGQLKVSDLARAGRNETTPDIEAKTKSAAQRCR